MEYKLEQQNCPICHVAPSIFIGYRGGKYHRQKLGIESNIYKCGRCSLLFPNPMPVPASGIEQHYGETSEAYFDRHEIEAKYQSGLKIVEEAESLLRGSGAILDIGAGQGAILRAARERGWRAVGIEPCAAFASFAADYSGAQIESRLLLECRFPSSSFNAVILAGCLEHLYNPDEVLAEISRILKPGGLLYTDVPNECGLYFRAGNLYERLRGRKACINLSPTFPPFHTFGFGPRSLKAILKKHQLSPVVWRMYEAATTIPPGASKVETVATTLITKISKPLGMASYIECWARRL